MQPPPAPARAGALAGPPPGRCVGRATLHAAGARPLAVGDLGRAVRTSRGSRRTAQAEGFPGRVGLLARTTSRSSLRGE